MTKFYRHIVNHQKMIIAIFLILFAVCAACQPLVAVNYDMNDYLPPKSPSTVALDLMDQEYDGGIPNARVMVQDVTIPQALAYKEQLLAVDGVTDVTWLDDVASVTVPLETLDADTVESYYKDGSALFSVTIAKEKRITAVDAIRQIIGDDNAMTGSAVSTAVATTSTVSEISTIAAIAVAFVLFVLIQSGYSEAQADAYLQTTEGQAAVAQAVANMTEEQKEQILQGAVDSLTEEQKAQIREAYIQQLMASDDVTSQINAAVATVSAAAKQVSGLKGQLDSYGVFYQGLVAYTDAVSNAAAGAKSLKLNMDTLYSNTGKLKLSVGELRDAVGELYDGTGELTDGTTEFVDKTSDMDTQISDEIDSMTASFSGGDGDTVSFVSEKNTNVNAVQFVIKTAAIEKAEAAVSDAVEEAPLTFWRKLLRLFGLY